MSTTTTHLMTAEELFNLEDDGYHRYELVKGELLTMSPANDRHGAATMTLSALLYNYVTAHDLGVLRAAETGFKLESDPDTVLAPDIAFISQERAGPLTDFFRIGPPDLAVEVRSRWDRKGKIERKTALWLELGAKSVWNVDPGKHTVEVAHADGNRWLLHDHDELVDDTVPGFRVLVSKIFE
ncbi:MAG TPA: Uma2 family endonuclease [Pyrinomonadaceae bacterium]|nr:Uma2 family endonuclease [Pyrinomonadaceae bacterium]